jgi:hypothetical protein
MPSLRVLTWCCVILLAILSFLPDQQMTRTGLPGRVEHFVAFAGSAAITIARYGATRGAVPMIGGFWLYAAILEYLRHFSPGRGKIARKSLRNEPGSREKGGRSVGPSDEASIGRRVSYPD